MGKDNNVLGKGSVMRLSPTGLAMASGVLWGAAILFVGVINLGSTSYGAAFLQFLASIYPGYHFTRGFGDLLVVTVYGFVDGWIGGFLLAWLYNRFSR